LLGAKNIVAVCILMRAAVKRWYNIATISVIIKVYEISITLIPVCAYHQQRAMCLTCKFTQKFLKGMSNA